MGRSRRNRSECVPSTTLREATASDGERRRARDSPRLASPGHRQGESKGNDDYLDSASQIQDQTQDALTRTMNLVEASKEVGESTLNELERQQEQIKDISADVMLIEDNLARADKLIRNFTKRMMTDKLIMCFAFLNMCGLVGIIVSPGASIDARARPRRDRRDRPSSERDDDRPSSDARG